MTFLTHLEDSTLQRFVSGDLVEAEASAARAHIEECSLCRRRASEVSQLFAVLAEPAPLPEPRADFLSLVMAQVEKEVPAPVLVTRAALLRGLAAGTALVGAGGALVASNAHAVPLHSTAAWAASTLVDVVEHANLLVTVTRAGAPVLLAAAAASLVLFIPVVWKTVTSLQPKPARATARV
ncbi:MAG TPA: hypothetical protein VMV18_05915 [bacterium]|nr:hypothetical protein [bacterium]